MLFRFLISCLLLSIFDGPLTSMENVSQFEVRKAGEEFAKEIEYLSISSPHDYNKGLSVIHRLLGLPFLPDNIPIKTLAKLGTNNDPAAYNELLKELYARVPKEKRKELSLEVFQVRNPRGILFHQEKDYDRIFTGDLLFSPETTPIYQSKHLIKEPFVLWNEPKLETKSIPNGKEVPGMGYMVKSSGNPKAVVIHVYGGRKESEKSALFGPGIDELNKFFLSNDIAVIELNLADTRKNTKHQREMDKEIFDENLDLIKKFRRLILENPNSLSDDPKAIEELKKIQKLPMILFGSSFGGLTVWEYAREFGDFDGYIVKEPALKTPHFPDHLKATPTKINSPVLILQNLNDAIVAADEVMNFPNDLTPEQRENIDIYMPKAGNLNVEKDYLNASDSSQINVGHFFGNGSNLQREENQILHFIEHLKDPKKESSLKKWREQRYELYAALTKRELVWEDLDKTFLALSRLTYEQRRFDGTGKRDIDSFDSVFPEVYAPLFYEMIIRAKEDYRFLLWQPLPNFDSRDKAVNFLETSNIKPYQTGFYPKIELEYTPWKTEEILKKEADVLGLPAPTLKEILGKNPDYFEKNRLGKEIAIKVVAHNLSQEIKEPPKELLDLKEKLKIEMKKWHNSVFDYLKEKSQEIEKIRKRFPRHQALMQMLSLNPNTEEWSMKFKAFKEILQSKKVAMKDDTGRTIWHLLVAESQRPELQGSMQVKRLQALVFSSEPSQSGFYLIKDKNGNTPLHLAIEFADPDLTQRLLTVSPPEVLKVKNRDGLTPLGLAAYNLLENHDEEIVKILLTHMESLPKDERTSLFNDEDNTGTTPLERLAIDWKSPFLWKAATLGADLNHKNSQNRTVKDYVQQASLMKDLKRYFEKTPNFSNNFENEAKGRQEEIQDLLEKGTVGAKINRWIWQEKWDSLYQLALRESLSETQLIKICSVLLNKEQYKYLTKFYFLPKIPQYIKKSIIDILVSKESWEDLAVIIMAEDVDPQIVKKTIDGLVEMWSFEKLKEIYLNPRLLKFKEQIIQVLIRHKKWSLLIKDLKVHKNGEPLTLRILSQVLGEFKRILEQNYSDPDNPDQDKDLDDKSLEDIANNLSQLSTDKAIPQKPIPEIICYFLKGALERDKDTFHSQLQKFLKTMPPEETREALSQAAKKLKEEKNEKSLKQLNEFALKYPKFKTSVLEAFATNVKNYKAPAAQIDLAPQANE